MNLQNIITYREDKEEESKTNTIENYINNNINNNIEDEKYLDNDINNENRKDLSNDINNESNEIEKNLNNQNENDIINNVEHDIENNNIEIDNFNNQNYFPNDNKNNNNFNYNNKDNNINNENNINNDSKNKDKINEKDIIDELLEKIRNNQDLGFPKENSGKSFDKLYEEVKLGLEQLNQIKTKSNKKTILDIQNEFEKKSYERNKKYNEVISELTQNLTKSKNNISQYKRGTYYNYKNIYILKPSSYFQTERKSKDIYEHQRKNENRFYLSSIDGKMIINGKRENTFKNYGENNGNYFSMEKRKNIEKINDLPDFRNRKINYFNKNYFKDELNRMNNMFSL